MINVIIMYSSLSAVPFGLFFNYVTNCLVMLWPLGGSGMRSSCLFLAVLS